MKIWIHATTDMLDIIDVKEQVKNIVIDAIEKVIPGLDIDYLLNKQENDSRYSSYYIYLDEIMPDVASRIETDIANGKFYTSGMYFSRWSKYAPEVKELQSKLESVLNDVSWPEYVANIKIDVDRVDERVYLQIIVTYDKNWYSKQERLAKKSERAELGVPNKTSDMSLEDYLKHNLSSYGSESDVDDELLSYTKDMTKRQALLFAKLCDSWSFKSPSTYSEHDLKVAFDSYLRYYPDSNGVALGDYGYPAKLMSMLEDVARSRGLRNVRSGREQVGGHTEWCVSWVK